MSRVAKIRQLGLEREVMELRQKGLGPVSISNILNEQHKLEGARKIIFSNVTNYLNSLSSETLDKLKEEHLQEVIIEPAMMLKKDLESFRGQIVPKIKNILDSNKDILSKDEINSLTAFMVFYR